MRTREIDWVSDECSGVGSREIAASCLACFSFNTCNIVQNATSHIEKLKASDDNQIQFEVLSDSKIVLVYYAATDSPWQEEGTTSQSWLYAGGRRAQNDLRPDPQARLELYCKLRCIFCSVIAGYCLLFLFRDAVYETTNL